ncbi:MAG: DUF3883 domain-containing protein [Pseudodesulfovibrio aespoeensis]|nr:DUF3883 domain-containing protein [Pseudodesulfovibrio aespoeensis]
MDTEEHIKPQVGESTVTSNYEAIREKNRELYGTDIARYGRILLADRYDDRTHFIFELLQNAEDALGRRGTWDGTRGITFDLTSESLTLSHFGASFNEADVRGVCGIAESTKDRSSVGRFGIGFKSVYTFTDRPEIHSGLEDFTVENYVQPRRADRLELKPEETRIILPLKPEDTTALHEITEGFKRLGPSSLLFLRHINEISWNAPGGASGIYLRSQPTFLAPDVQKITVIGQESGQADVDQNWIVFRRDVFLADGAMGGSVEVAFSVEADGDEPGQWSVRPVPTSPLVVFFPTVVSTNLGFLVQGPYLTTPSRDNIRQGEPWNQHLVEETAALVVDAIRWFREKSMLDTSTLRCLPLDRQGFKDSMFAPFFEAVRQAFLDEALLPRFGGGYVAAGQAKLARTQELRELFSPGHVAVLFDIEGAAWLSGDITEDKAPEIRKYLMRELEIEEVTPAKIVSRLSREFLEAQADEWIVLLYQFLSEQETALRRYLDTIPLLRLADGSHIVARENGKPTAFLPSGSETGFPTIRNAVCSTMESRNFLLSLGITEPDLVDDIIWNVKPKYDQSEVVVGDTEYVTDIERILAAFETDSKAQRQKLLSGLRETAFVKIVEVGSVRSEGYGKPSETYLATERLKQLFAGVPGIQIVDDSYFCLRGENIRELLEACGALRYPRPVEAPNSLTREERQELRRQAGHEDTSRINDRVTDWNLQGFDALLKTMPTLAREERVHRALLIWESLGDLAERRGEGLFEGKYTWTHYGNYQKEFPAAFIRQLNSERWVPDAAAELQLSESVVFDFLGWKPNSFLLSKIPFKPPIIDQLAKEAGIDPAVLDLLKKHGLTNVSDLASRLGISQPSGETDGENEEDNQGTVTPYEEDVDSTGNFGAGEADDLAKTFGSNGDENSKNRSTGRGTHGPVGGDDAATGQSKADRHTRGESRPAGDSVGEKDRNARGNGGSRSSGHAGGHPFISYVGAHPDAEPADPDGLDHAMRMKIEEQAIEQIIQIEPALRRTPPGNPGFDLYEIGSDGEPIRWVEVKSMTGSLADHPVGLSRTQFNFARECGMAYWLYVVEYATNHEKTRILRIQDPASRAKTFTFDHGWSQIAQEIPLS